ncbi:MAG: hypothetical protein PF636_11520 [Actinomycetota bacterium]|jgi:hypothetical protein|nr:hypothetical protein [Actinomycetota bacterium]
MTPTNDLRDTIQRLRQEKYPDLPEDLVAEIIATEEDCPENRQEAIRRIRELIEAHLNTTGE